MVRELGLLSGNMCPVIMIGSMMIGYDYAEIPRVGFDAILAFMIEGR